MIEKEKCEATDIFENPKGIVQSHRAAQQAHPSHAAQYLAIPFADVCSAAPVYARLVCVAQRLIDPGVDACARTLVGHVIDDDDEADAAMKDRAGAGRVTLVLRRIAGCWHQK